MLARIALRLVLAVVVAASVIAGCDAGESRPSAIDHHPTTLAGTSWLVAAVAGVRPGAVRPPTIAFDAGRAQGDGGCNAFGGGYRYDAATGALRFDQLVTTLAACLDEARGAFESRMFEALGQPTLIVTQQPDGSLRLSSPAGPAIDLVMVGPVVTD